LMRTRAADTGEYAGSDAVLYMEDGVWTSAPKKADPPQAAMVTVWRLVQGQRCKFEAVARWSEYKPEPGPSGQGDTMWRRMPHTMLGKCAEALALRKGFPRQLAGLYAAEEMDQANRQAAVLSSSEGALSTADPNVHAPAGLSAEDLPSNQRYILKVEPGMGKAKGFLHHSGQEATDTGIPMYDEKLADLARDVCRAGDAVQLTVKISASNKPYVTGIARITSMPDLNVHSVPVDDKDLPF
jgi:hypothetical protein